MFKWIQRIRIMRMGRTILLHELYRVGFPNLHPRQARLDRSLAARLASGKKYPQEGIVERTHVVSTRSSDRRRATIPGADIQRCRDASQIRCVHLHTDTAHSRPSYVSFRDGVKDIVRIDAAAEARRAG